MSTRFLHDPPHGSEGLKHKKLPDSSWSSLGHFAIVLLILLTASVESSLTVREGAPAESAPSASAPSSTAGRTPSSQVTGELTGKHVWKDAAAMVVCFLAASLWWLVRSPSGRQQLPVEGSRPLRPLVLLPNPWNADEQERKRISRDLHDCVGQVLTAASLELSSLRSSGLLSDQQQKLDNVAQLNVEALRLVRDLAMGLRPAMLDDLGLTAALQWQVRQFSRRTGIAASIHFCGEIDPLPEPHRTCIYRCVQEALTNCARHSKARKVEVVLAASPGVATLTVEDDGVGVASEAIASPGLGILGMHERVEALGGRVSIEPRREGGTRLHFEIPVTVEAHA
jgi:signal transduction histidine kinase